MAINRTVVNVTQRRWISGFSYAIERASRERVWIERLEARVLMAGQIDPTFGVMGVQRGHQRFEDGDNAIVNILPQPNGSLTLEGSDFAGGQYIVRLTTDGSIDSSLGAEDPLFTVRSSWGVADPWWINAGPLAVDPQGRFLVTWGSSWNDGHKTVTLQRLLQDGKPDSSFGTNSKTTVPLGGHVEISDARGTVVDAFGRIIIAAVANDQINETHSYFFLRRFTPNGVVDTTFGNNGVLALSTPNGDGVFGSLVMDQQGRLVVSGFAFANRDGKRIAAIARLNTDGQLDATFGKDGWFIADFGRDDVFNTEPHVDSQGRIVSWFMRSAAGKSRWDAHDTGILRLTSEGKLDTSFAGDGVFELPETWGGYGWTGRGNAVGIQPDDKVLVHVASSDISPGGLLRLNDDGTPDLAFGDDGTAYASQTSRFTIAFAEGNRILLGQSVVDIADAWGDYAISWAVSAITTGDVIPISPAVATTFWPVTASAPQPEVSPTSPVTEAQESLADQPATQPDPLPILPFSPHTVSSLFASQPTTSRAISIVDSDFTDDLLAPAAEELPV